MVKISIVVPVYNVESYLEKCYYSLINQSYENIEILLIDDGSSDSSGDMCDYYSKNKDKVYVFHKKNGGLSDVRNYCLKKVTGDYVLFVDSDDFIDLDTCKKFIEVIGDNQLDIITGNFYVLRSDSKEKITHTHVNNAITLDGKRFLEMELKSNSMHMAAWLNLYNRKFLELNKLFFKKGLLHEDEEFTPRAFLKAEKVISSNITFYNYLKRESSITTQKNQ